MQANVIKVKKAAKWAQNTPTVQTVLKMKESAHKNR